ncbi:MAG: type II toxin-antitoxin system RelE/ParE family toxin [Chloroflexi bacterium]|nr:type II toxin-antitoxin system RelE/ParE family toxin [Chloroflexota bacterium]
MRRLPRQAQERILRRLHEIAEDPYGQHTKPLVGAGGRRAARVDSWRIVFAVDEEAQLVTVSDIGPRGDVYRHVRDL